MVVTSMCAYGALAKEAAPAIPLPQVSPLPEGNTGIASKYAGDAGIEKDPAVLLYDNFESGNLKKWDNHFHDEYTHFTEDPANVHGGRKTLEFVVPKTDVEVGNGIDKHFKPGYEVLFIRYYSKFDKGFDQIGSSHNGAYISASYNRDGHATPGERADGKNKFLVGLENSRFDEKLRSPGMLNFYCYHPEQRSNYGDHFNPSGMVTPYDDKLGNNNTFGSNFIKRPEFIPELDRWYCYEFMVKMNTPGQRDGRIACWVDGKLVADIPNFRLRDVDTLKIDACSLSLHVNCKTQRDNKKWYDDVVIATSYVGPTVTEKAAPPPPVVTEPVKPIVQKPAAPVISTEALAPWQTKLTQRITQGIKDGQNPKAWLKLTGGREEEVKVVGIDEKSLSIEQGGGVLPLPWSKLSAGDRLNLARAFLKDDSADDHLLVAVLALAAERHDLADEQFAKAQVADPRNGTAQVKEIRTALGLK
jgi:hypothetical protein